MVGSPLAKEAPMPAARNVPSILVKRYARSRLYDTARRCYMSVEQLRQWAAEGVVFSVIDAETGSDVTRVRRA